MSSFILACILWFRAMLFTASLIAGFVFIEDGFSGGIAFFLVFVVGCFLTSPLLVIIPFVIQGSLVVPYSINAKLGFLCFLLSILTVAFFALFLDFFDGTTKLWALNFWLTSTLISVWISTFSIKPRFTKLALANARVSSEVDPTNTAINPQ
ncbi:MAG: hypothetical protein H7Y31_02125 [Chitinophagaceae bacterium]|nr:hypothetical protein [Chitinophagaceae bacterium]